MEINIYRQIGTPWGLMPSASASVTSAVYPRMANRKTPVPLNRRLPCRISSVSWRRNSLTPLSTATTSFPLKPVLASMWRRNIHNILRKGVGNKKTRRTFPRSEERTPVMRYENYATIMYKLLSSNPWYYAKRHQSWRLPLRLASHLEQNV